MNAVKLIDSMEAFAELLPVLVSEVTPEDARWKPPSGNWSILEIVSHLIDEEVEDFRVRLQMTIEDPRQTWPTWDPEGCAISRNYNERDFSGAVAKFVAVRKESLSWLRGLSNVDWDVCYEHPKMGAMTAGKLLASWVAHDQLHVRQIVKRKFEMIQRDAAPYDTSYAGPW